MSVDILVSVYGAHSVVKECMDTWFPIPNGFNLYVYNNKASDIDGTTEYLLEKQKEYNFNLIDERKNLWHPNAIHYLVKHTTSTWILHLDSDVKLKSKDKFFEWILEKTNDPKYKCWGRMEQSVPISNFDIKIDRDRFLDLPRAHQCVLFFNRGFYELNNLDFFGFYFEGKLKNGNLKLKNRKTLKVLDDIQIRGDTGWKIFYRSVAENCFSCIPDEIYDCFEHKNSSSVNWKIKNADKIKD